MYTFISSLVTAIAFGFFMFFLIDLKVRTGV